MQGDWTVMGVREESHPAIIIRGYSGQIRPKQLEGGKCKECREPVFVDEHENVKTTLHQVAYIHWACGHE